MIEDPLSILSLGIFLFAAGMWPVGFLFGACSPCCSGPECPYEPEFSRCVRWRKKFPNPVKTDGSPQRIRGFSRRTQRPDDIGAFKVASTVSVRRVIRILSEIRRLSSGEDIIASVQLRHANGNPYGPAVSLSVSGVTIPLSAPAQNAWSGSTSRLSSESQTFGAATFPTPLSSGLPAPGTWSADVTAVPHTWESVNAAISAEVLDAYMARVPSQNLIDGSVFTREYLKSLVSVSVSRPSGSSSGVRFSMSWTAPPQESLAYCPSTSTTTSPDVRYLIRISRGSMDTYFTVVLRLRGQGQQFPPGEGPFSVTPPTTPAVSQPPDSQPPPQSVLVTENSVTLSSHAVPAGAVGSTSGGLLVEPPAISYSPQGADLVSSLSESVSNGSPASPYWRIAPGTSATATETRYALRLRMDPPGLPGLQQAQETVYDLDLVEDFLSGEEELTGTFTEFDRPFSFDPLGSEEWIAEVQDAHPLCQHALCQALSTVTRHVQALDASPVAITGTYTLPALPETWTVNTEKGLETRTNYCFGEDQPPRKFQAHIAEVSGFLNRDVPCGWRTSSVASCASLSVATCPPLQNPDFSTRSWSCATPGQRPPTASDLFLSGQVNIPSDALYAGDLLWTLENGPATTSVTYENGAVFSISEQAEAVDGYCPSPAGLADTIGVAMAVAGLQCWPTEVVVSVPARRAYTFDWLADCEGGKASNFWGSYPSLTAGDVVCDLKERGCLGARWESPPMPQITIPGPTPVAVPPLIRLWAYRPNWCDEIDTTELSLGLLFNFGSNCVGVFRFGAGLSSYPQASEVGFGVAFSLEEPLALDFSPQADSVIATSSEISSGGNGGPVNVAASSHGWALPADFSAVWGGIRSQPFSSFIQSYFTDSTVYIYPLASANQGGGSLVTTHPTITPGLFPLYSPPASIKIAGHSQCTLANSGDFVESSRNGTVYAYYRSSIGIEAGGAITNGPFGLFLPRESACVLVLIAQPSGFYFDTRTLCDLDSVEVLPNPSTGQIPFWVQNIGFLDPSVPKSRRVVKFTIPPTPLGGGPAGAFGSFTIRIHSGSSYRDVLFSRNN